MTLNKAIKEMQTKALDLEDIRSEVENKENKTHSDIEFCKKCDELVNKYSQLAEWLIELKYYKEKENGGNID